MRISDWISDVCSSDLKAHQLHLAAQLLERRLRIVAGPAVVAIIILVHHPLLTGSFRAPCLSLNPAPARGQGRRCSCSAPGPCRSHAPARGCDYAGQIPPGDRAQGFSPCPPFPCPFAPRPPGSRRERGGRAPVSGPSPVPRPAHPASSFWPPPPPPGPQPRLPRP